jgi:hypothetical protein
MVFEAYYSILFSWNNGILKMSNFPHKIYRSNEKKCDLLSLHCPGDIVTLFVKEFSMNLLSGS